LKKIILDLCGGTGSWTKYYPEKDYDVRIITLPDNDVRTYKPPKNVYGILAAPPCTMFSFARMSAKKPRDLTEGMEIVIACLNIIWECQYKIKSSTQKSAPLKFWCLENPNGFLKYFLGNPVYEFNPYDFGDNWKKRTQLWGYFNFPKKKPIKCDLPKYDHMASKDLHPEYFGKYDRLTRRSMTPFGFAKAFYEANK
tara:strand:- start:33 stop:623 length:591 start_codon:yes stop_codon:yes gene_type:complete